MQVSLLIAAKNGQDTVADCLNSVLNQSVPFDEIIVGVDHCQSTVEALTRAGYPNKQIGARV